MTSDSGKDHRTIHRPHPTSKCERFKYLVKIDFKYPVSIDFGYIVKIVFNYTVTVIYEVNICCPVEFSTSLSKFKKRLHFEIGRCQGTTT